MKNFRKEKLHRPLSNRIFAILMAVVMVFSVVYINNRNDVALAEEPIAFEDDSYLAGIIDLSSNVEAYIVHVPEKNVQFTLPEAKGEKTGEKKKVYYYNNGSKNIASFEEPTDLDEEIEVTEVEIAPVITYAWSKTDSSSVDPTSIVTAELKAYYVEKTTYYNPDDETEALISSSKSKIIVEEKTEAGNISKLNVTNSIGKITFTDSCASEDTVEVQTKNAYYGDVIYSADSLADADIEELNEYASAQSDGTINVTRKITVQVGAEEKILVDEENASFAKNTVLLTAQSYKVGTDDEVNVEVGNNINVDAKNPTKDVVISFTTDAATDSAVFTAGEGSPAATPSISDTVYTYTIPGSVDNNGKTYTYTFAVEQAPLSQTVSVAVKYLDGTPTVTAGDFGGYEKGGVSFFGTNSIDISGTANVASGSGAVISSAALYGAKSDGTVDLSKEAKTIAVTGTSESESLSASANLDEGINYFILGASSSFGIQRFSGVISAYYDKNAPTVSRVKVVQDANSISEIASASEYTINKKISCKDDAVIEVTAADADDESGLATITCDGTPITDGKFTIPADNSNNNKSKTYSFVAKDYVGNETSFTVTVEFADETIDIKHSIVKSSDLSAEVMEMFNDTFPKWESTDKTGRQFVIKYVVTSQVDIKSASVNYNGTDTTLTEADSQFTDGKYIYTYFRPYDASASKVYENIVFTAVNKHNASETDTIDIINVDSDDPTSLDSIDSTKWYTTPVVLNVGDTSSTPTAGLKEVTDIEGCDGSSTVAATDGKVALIVKESTSVAGTSVKFKAHDNVGNVLSFEKTIKIDLTAPTTGLSIEGISAEEMKSSAVTAIKGDPVISYSVSDNIAIDTTATTATISKNGGAAVTLVSGQKLSTYFSDLTAKDEITVTVYVKDIAGNETTDTKSFTVDNNPPVPNIVIDTPSTGTVNHFNTSNVKFTITVKDDGKLKDTDLVITDNDTPVVANWKFEDSGVNVTAIAEVNSSSEGVHTIKIVAKDTAGNANSASRTISIDRTVPTIAVTLNGNPSKDNNGYVKQPARFKETKCTDKLTVEITKDGAPYTVSNAKSFELTQDGVYKIKYIAEDSSSNKTTYSTQVVVDNKAPSAKIDIKSTSKKNNNYYDGRVSLEFTVGDINPTTVKATNNTTDVSAGLEWKTSGNQKVATYSTGAQGVHTIKLEVTDGAGNKTIVTKTFTIDTTAPTLSQRINKVEYDPEMDADEIFKKAVTTTVDVTDKNEDASDVVVTAVRTAYDDSEKVTKSYKGKKAVEFTKEGIYKVTYKVTDLAGNVATAVYKFKIDKTAPINNMYIKTAKPAKFKQFNNTYKNEVGLFEAREDQEEYQYGQYYNTDVVIEINTFDYNLDEVSVMDNDFEAEFTPKSLGEGYYRGTVTISEEGAHVITITSKDTAGNSGADTKGSKILKFTIDKTAPSIVTTLNGNAYGEGQESYLASTATVGVSVVDNNKDMNDLTRTVKTNSPVGGQSSSTAKVQEGSETHSTEADYEISYVAVDRAGNESPAKTIKFRVDTAGPELSISSNAAQGVSTKDVTVTFNIKETFYADMVSSNIDVYKKVDGSGESRIESINFMPHGAADSMTKSYSEDGQYRFTFTAEDKAGHSASTDYTFILDGKKPVITLSGVKNYDKTSDKVELGVQIDETFYLSNKVKLEGTYTDIDGKKSAIDFDKFPSTQGKISQLQKLFTKDGIYDITVTSTDKAGNTDTKSVHFTIDKTAPEIGDISQYDGKVVNEFVWDADENKLIKDLTVCTTKLYLDGVEYDGVSPISDGTHTLKIEATDEMGQKSVKEVTFVLDTKAPNVIITGVQDGQRIHEATEITIQPELDTDTLVYVKMNGTVVGYSGNKATFTVDKRGAYTVSLLAEDEAGNRNEMEINFNYGSRFPWWLILIIIAVVGGITGLIVGLKKKNKVEKKWSL